MILLPGSRTASACAPLASGLSPVGRVTPCAPLLQHYFGVWKCLGKIAAPNAFAGATQLDRADVGDIDLLDFDRPRRSAMEGDELLRRRIRRRLVTLASVIEKVEALAELPPPHPDKPA